MIRLLVFCLFSLCTVAANAAPTYANTSTTYSWIDATAHSQVGYNTTPYKFNGGFGCGSTPPVIDDTLSDVIPIGFNFVFGDKVFDAVRIQSNGRLQMVSTTLPLDNTTCGYGSPVTQLPMPNAGLNYTLRIYGSDLDPTLKSEAAGYTTNCTSRTGATPCFVSVGNVGTVPGSRKFVVTWSNVPEWAAGSTATGSYNVQIVLLDNGNFIYQFGTDVPGPQANNGQVGWQISTTDYDAPSFGYPVPNTAILFFVPHPIIEYLMEQASWTGAGSVLDTSGNDKNGSPVGTAQTTAGGKICRGADFPAVGGNAISTGVPVPTIGNSGTIAFWYKANTAWSGAGTKDVQLFDATTTSGQWFSLVRRGGLTTGGGNGGKLRFVVTDSGGTARVVETAAIAVAANTYSHIAVTWDFNNVALANNDKIRIYVDGVLQKETTFTSTTLTLSPTIGSLNIGGTRSGFSELGTAVTSADGVLDEFRAYNYAATAATIVSIKDLNANGCINHYSIAAPATGLGCQSTTITIAPHTLSHAAYISNGKILLSTSDGKGDWVLQNGHGVLIPGTVNTGAATYIFTSETQVVLSLIHPNPGTVTIGVSDGSNPVQENTPIVINNCAATKFIACEVSSPRCVPVVGSVAYANLNTKLASRAFALDVATLNIDGSLDSTFSKAIAVKLLASSSAPTSFNATSNCPTSPTATISLGNVTLASGRAPVAGVAVSTTAFSAVAPKYAAYPDVRVQFVCSAANCPPSGITTCSPDAFSVRPQTLTVTSSANADNSGVSAALTPVIKAGVAFTLTAGANTAGYFGSPAIDATKAEWLSAPASGRASPGVGTVAGVFSTPASIGTGNGATGNFTYNEVGYFRFTSGGVSDSAYAAISGDVGNGDCTNDFSNTLVSRKYGCNVANQAATNYFGRFIPDHFSVIPVSVTPACTGFTYFGQDGLQTAFTLQAQTAGNVVTQNYSGSFAKLGLATWGNFTFTAATLPVGSVLAASVTAPTGTWGTPATAGTGGQASVVAKHIAGRPGGPAVSTSIIVSAQPTDSDAVTVPSAVALHATATPINYGRLWLGNAYGSDQLDLALPIEIQSWNGSVFVKNVADNCTSLAAGNIALGNKQGGLSAYTGPVNVSSIVNGAGKITLTKPGSATAGSVDLVVTLGSSGSPANCKSMTGATSAALPHLSGKWCGANNDRDPIAKATFGIFGGSEKKGPIYIRESY